MEKFKKILITSGGTYEPIDSVRRITNLSKGRLGAKIADEFTEHDEVEKIYFLHARGSDKPKTNSGKIELVNFTDVASLEKLSYELLAEEQISDIIHAAAVSDFRVAQILDAEGNPIDKSGKISSGLSGMMLKLEPTPKVISKFKKISPDSNLIGFKLLYDAPIEELMRAADKTLKNNGCSHVLANRLIDVKDENHIGYLRGQSGTVEIYNTKTEIAKGLARCIGLGKSYEKE